MYESPTSIVRNTLRLVEQIVYFISS